MKSKKRHHSSSEESDEANESVKSSSSSDSESDDSSVSEHRYKKKRKHAESSDSVSQSDDQKRSKKRKHKKKKKKHGKKKRRSESVERGSVENVSSLSEGEITSKKKRKHKHKHSKRAADSSPSEVEEHEPRLHSVVKERRVSSEEGSQPSRTYYQKEYRRSASVENYDREREVQRFYRGSSKEHRLPYPEQYGYERERNERFVPYQDKYDKSRERYGQSMPYNPNAEYNRRHKEFDEYKRNPKYDERRFEENYNRRQREDAYHSREDPRGYNRYNQYEERAPPKRREMGDGRDYRERRGPPDVERYREREYTEKKERYREDRYSAERNRDFRREHPARIEKPPLPPHRDHSKSKSPVDRYREKSRRLENREERDDRGRPPRETKDRVERRDRSGEERRERVRRSEERPRGPNNDYRPRERKSRFADVDDKKEYDWGKAEVKKEGSKTEVEKEKPNFGLSGKLTADANTVNGVVIKYSEPDDAKQPKRRWRFYPFKGDKALPILYIHRQSCFLIGRDKKVVDIPLDHPSISKQHAALQYRATPFTRPDGSQGRRVRPYIIDLDSANGTFVNNKKIEPRRYVELLERDVVKFGFSQREYVLLHENSKDDAQDDDNQEPPALGAAVTTTDQIKQEKRIKEEMVADGE
ncbi:unnamed protein product [Parnassius mnemosyne]|uniref:FHA domain-containing protein n=1 Tax=Parnassius mnemosyne TaxID=213953 RepID=A0AAV1KU26_9NEOP